MIRILISMAVFATIPALSFAQTGTGSLPGVSAPTAYGSTPITGITASSATSRALSPPPGLSPDAPTGLTLNFGIGASRHSNPQRQDSDDTDSDVASVFNPLISYGGEFGRHQYQVGYNEGSKSFSDFSAEDSDYERLSGALRLDLTRILIADIYGSRVDAVEVRGTSGARDITFEGDQDEYTHDSLGGRITLGRRSNLLQLYAGGETRDLEYTNNNQGFRDRDEDMIEGGLFFNVGTSTALFVHGKERQIDYLVSNPSLDSTETAITAGVTWEATDAISLLLEAGNLKKEFDDPSIAGFDGTTYLGKLQWSPRDRTNLSLYTSRTTEESADAAAPYYLSEVSGIDITQRIGGGGTATLHYARADDEYSTGRRDNITDYGITFGYALFPWMDVGVAYNVIDKESNQAGSSFEDEIVSAFVNLKPRIGSDE